MHNVGYVALSADVISAYVSNNKIMMGDLPGLIQSVHDALKTAAEGKTEQKPEPLTPPVPINKTVKRDRIISLEDGKAYASLKRHLTARGLTPEQYRTKWGLRPDYPMVAPEYSERRSALAKALGLGQKRKGAKAAGKKKAS